MMYHNYHRHDHYSNIRTSDVIVKPEHYIERIKELRHTHYFTTNHGCSGDVFEAYELCKKNNLTCVYGMEMYYTDDRFNKNKDSKTYHIIVIGLTKNAYYHINRISSLANTEGFYNKPRIDLELLLSLPPEEIVITTACMAGRLFKDTDYIEEFVLPLKKYFKNNFLLEVQSHNHQAQIEWNRKILELSKKYNIPIIHGCDSHYIYTEQSKDRLDFLHGKGMNYGDEDSFILDYPNYEIILERYKTQGVLSEQEAKISLENTLIFNNAEDLGFTKEVKMPTIYPELTIDERYEKLSSIVKNNLKDKLKNVPKEKHKDYIDAVQFELNIIKETNIKDVRTADYFLINERIINKGVNEYDGILTKTGRGSAVSFLVNHLLGFTEIDRLDAEVPLYPTRFMSKSRILETRSLPDIDFNTSDPIPFIRASKDVLGEDGCYYMVAYGTLKMSGSFRMMCRAKNIGMDKYNEFGKKVSEVEKIKDKEERSVEYGKLLKDETFGEILKESEKFVGVIDSVAPSPCSFLLLDKPISTEVGLIKIKDEICCMVDGMTAENYKFLKNDILTVTVWKIISDTYKELNQPIPTIKELRGRLDNKVWKLYEDGITKTLNQTDSDFAIPLVMKYAPRNAGELTAWVASIRPSFASLLNGFLDRKPYSTGTKELDNLLKDSFHYLLYQENIMQYLTWLGVEEDETYGLIKKISKKTLKDDEIIELEKTLRTYWIEHIGNDDRFEETWQVVKSSASYGFNSSHALSVCWDSLYGAELKAHHPLVYFTTVFNVYKDNTKKIAEITNELNHFNIKQKPIQFRYSRANYSYDVETNSIYKGIASLKHLNEKVSDELYSLRNRKYDSFIDLLIDMKHNVSINTRQLEILIMLDFFNEFGGSDKLLRILKIYEDFGNAKVLNKAKLNPLETEIVKKYARETNSQYRDLDLPKIINELTDMLENKDIPLKDRLETQLEYLGYIDYINPNIDKSKLYVVDVNTKYTPVLTLYCLNNGNTNRLKLAKKKYNNNPIDKGDFILMLDYSRKPRKRKIDDKWIELPEKEWHLENYIVEKE